MKLLLMIHLFIYIIYKLFDHTFLYIIVTSCYFLLSSLVFLLLNTEYRKYLYVYVCQLENFRNIFCWVLVFCYYDKLC